MKSVMAHLEPDQSLDVVLSTSLLCATKFDAYLEAVHLKNSEPELVAAGADGFIAATPELMAGLEQEAADRSKHAREGFEAFREAHALRRLIDVGIGQGLSVDWRILHASSLSAIGQWGRVFDLIVVGSAREDQPSHRTAIFETVLFESGRPVLIAPPTAPESLAERIVIAWNGSTETARAVAMAQPMLKRASEVTVLSVEGAMVTGPTGEDLVRNLRHQGIDANGQTVTDSDRKPGAVILQECAKVNADLLIKGAFTQSRLRQMIFGGATSHIIANADLPVLMVH